MGTELLRLTEIRYLDLTFMMDQQQDGQRTLELGAFRAPQHSGKMPCVNR